MSQLFRKKNLQQLIRDAGDPNVGHEGGTGGGLKRSLGAFNLTMLGIGAIIGAGIFSLTGAAAAFYAGPAIVYSFVIGGILCALAGLCYAEMAAMVPVAGSAYAYSYATMGELVAWIIGWDLVLEYAFGAVAVSSSWSGYLVSLVHKTLGVEFSDTVLRLTKGPWELVTLGDGSQVHGICNFPASLLSLIVGYILVKGVQESALINNIIVLVKCAIILVFIALGWSVVDQANWVGDASVTGLLRLIPPPSTVLVHGKEILSYGMPGVLTGAGVVFFAYIGFDALSTTAQECRNPKRDLPIGILASLVVCTVLYVLVALVLTGVVPYRELGVPDPVAVGIDRIVALRGWSPVAQKGFTFLIKLGALAGLTSVVLVLMMGQARIFYAMAKDGLLPWFHRVHPKYSTPHIATMVTAVFVSLSAAFMPMSLVGELVSIGTLLAFVLVCVGIPILRVTHPQVERPFRTPAYLLVAPAGAIACMWVMSGLPLDTWLRLIVWLIIGMAVYVFYGRKNSRLGREQKIAKG